MFTIKTLKKMATERISRIFENVYGYVLFNPYEDREYMILAIVGSQMTDEIGTEERATVTPDWNNVTQSSAMRVYHPIITKIYAAINNTWLPVREERKGRKSEFSYRDIWDMLYADISGMRLKDIAEYFGTSSQMVINILTGKSYNWASGIPTLGVQ